jgi:hypothetical protein
VIFGKGNDQVCYNTSCLSLCLRGVGSPPDAGAALRGCMEETVESTKENAAVRNVFCNREWILLACSAFVDC